MYDRTDEYEGFMDYMGNRTNKVGIKIAAGEAGVLNENLIEEHDADENDHKRAYEMTEEELVNDGFNPTHDREIAAVLRKIDNAASTGCGTCSNERCAGTPAAGSRGTSAH